VIDRQARQMARLLDDLLDVSRITRGKIQLQPQRLDLSSVLDHAVESCRGFMEQREHTLSVSRPDHPVFLVADATRLHQIIANLLSNAARYTEPGGRVTLSLTQEEGTAVLRVSDTGIGIDPDFLPHVFDLFVQGKGSLARADSGLGVGLTMVKSLVELHRGTVVVQSAGLGRGSTFEVRLPMADSSTGEESGPVPSPVAGRAATQRRVLVVDDNRDAAETLTELVALWGYEVRAAQDGLLAISLAREYRPEVILLDISMPGMDGYETAHRLRQHPRLRSTTLIALTGYGQAQDRRRAREAGFDHHLTKPVDPEALRELLTAVEPREAATAQERARR
jgi:two-component system CheB/CheR fusion protein